MTMFQEPPSKRLCSSSTQKATVPALYAEYLPKLGRVSIIAHLPSPATQDTTAKVSSDGALFTVHHQGITHELQLPVNIVAPAQGSLNQIPLGLEKISWRMVVRSENTGVNGSSGSVFGLGSAEDAMLWSAVDLKSGVDVVCGSCRTVVVPRNQLEQWKDLPSENWAEMMEFWHCHKPVTHKSGGAGVHEHGHDHTEETENGANNHDGHDQAKAPESQLAARGYGANSSIMAQKGVGFVDLTKLLFHVEDCLSVAVNVGDETSSVALEEYLVTLSTQGENKSVSSNPPITCASCYTQLGHFESRKWGISLFKWESDLVDDKKTGDADEKPLPSAPTLSHCLAAALVETQARCGTAKVVLQGETEAITVWILNPYVKFSCHAKQQVAAMKLLFQNKAMDEEELVLPDEVVREAREILQEGNTYLPPDEKATVFRPEEGTWTVSLLERAER